MPANVVKTKRDERLWSQAEKSTKKQYSDVSKDSNRWWSIVQGIFQRMKLRLGGKPKTAEAVKNVSKSEYIKLSQEIAREYFVDTRQDITSLIVKCALINSFNENQINNICATSNHLIHAVLLDNKKEDADKYIDFKIARPEKVAKLIDELTDIVDDIYYDPDTIFSKVSAKKAARESYGEHIRKTVRRGQLLKQNIKNIASAHSKIANELLVEVDKAKDKIEQLYRLVRQAVEGDKDLEIIRDVLSKAFDDANNFSLIWADIELRLIADNIVKRPIQEKDRIERLDIIDNWSPSPSSPIVTASMEINRRLNRTDELEKILHGLEKMASDAKVKLTEVLVLEKQAALGAIIKGVGSWAVKKIPKFVTKSVNPVKDIVKKKGKGRYLMGAAWIGVDAVPAAGTKTVKIMRTY